MSQESSPLILWFRQDLRLHDNPALNAAIKTGAKILPIYILDDIAPGPWKMGSASRVWLYHSLSALNVSLNDQLIFMSGPANQCLNQLIETTQARGVYWNRCYEPFAISRDQMIKENLKKGGLDVQSFNASLLYEPWTVTKSDGTPYRVFTPFWGKGCLGMEAPPKPIPSLKIDPLIFAKNRQLNIGLNQLPLLPHAPRWDTGMIKHWTPGEKGAQKQFHHFLENVLSNYKERRNFPAHDNTSRLSPHLHFGEISPRQIFYDIKNVAAADPRLDMDTDHFLSEIGWREFSNHLLYHNPTLPERPLQPAFEKFPWADLTLPEQSEMIDRWKQGKTGVPIVDAGMRELWQTGYMHNRVRMIVGSYLVKNMLTHWHVGENWFWDTLVDADLANNAASWQWIAGCGADAAPYYRIFNPMLQTEKFDPNNAYIRRWIPEWDTPRYPAPMINHATARLRALEALKKLK